jgi:hypothetical protein
MVNEEENPQIRTKKSDYKPTPLFFRADDKTKLQDLVLIIDCKKYC